MHLVKSKKCARISNDNRYLLQLCKQDRTKTSRQLTSEWLLSSGKTVSDSTERIESGNKNYTAKPKTIRTAIQKQKSLSIAKRHLNWLSDNWNKVIWNNISHFELFNSKNRTSVRRKPICYSHSFRDCRKTVVVLVFENA